MAYTPTEWKCGDTITAEKLNKLENGLADCCGGGGSEPLIIRFDVERSNTEGVALYDKTWQQVFDALNNAIPVYAEWGFYDKSEGASKRLATLYPCITAFYDAINSNHKVLTTDTNFYYFDTNPNDYLMSGNVK